MKRIFFAALSQVWILPTLMFVFLMQGQQHSATDEINSLSVEYEIRKYQFIAVVLFIIGQIVLVALLKLTKK